MRIGVVGVCASGKSVLVRSLVRAGYDAHEIGQEHSYVPDMWNRIHPPDVLIFLDASYATVAARRPASLMTKALHAEMLQRLQHARTHADLLIETDSLTEDEVFRRVLSYLTHL